MKRATIRGRLAVQPLFVALNINRLFLNNIIVVKFHVEASFFCRMAEKSGDNPGRSEGKVRRLKWDNDNMKAAMEAVSSGEMTVSASSRCPGRPWMIGSGVMSWKEAWSYHHPHT